MTTIQFKVNSRQSIFYLLFIYEIVDNIVNSNNSLL